MRFLYIIVLSLISINSYSQIGVFSILETESSETTFLKLNFIEYLKDYNSEFGLENFHLKKGKQTSDIKFTEVRKIFFDKYILDSTDGLNATVRVELISGKVREGKMSVAIFRGKSGTEDEFTELIFPINESDLSKHSRVQSVEFGFMQENKSFKI